jgi:hypothetical protein
MLVYRNFMRALFCRCVRVLKVVSNCIIGAPNHLAPIVYARRSKKSVIFELHVTNY